MSIDVRTSDIQALLYLWTHVGTSKSKVPQRSGDESRARMGTLRHQGTSHYCFASGNPLTSAKLVPAPGLNKSWSDQNVRKILRGMFNYRCKPQSPPTQTLKRRITPPRDSFYWPGGQRIYMELSGFGVTILTLETAGSGKANKRKDSLEGPHSSFKPMKTIASIDPT